MSESREEELRRILDELDTQWELGNTHSVLGLGECCMHPDTGESVSNSMYDDMVAEFKKLSPKDIRFARPGGAANDSGVKKIKHDPPLTSISKASHEILAEQEKQLYNWLVDRLEDVSQKEEKSIVATVAGNKIEYPKRYFVQSYKLDGVAIGLYYEKGKLVRAGLRPRDGINGEDVTENVKYVKGIPTELPEPLTCSIRGELICRLSDFQKVQKELSDAGDKLRANPRNHAAGAIRQFKDPTKTKAMRLSFVGYSIEGLNDPPYKNEVERAKWSNKVLKVPFVQTRWFCFDDLKKMEDNLQELDYEVDGVVISVNNLEAQEQCGRTGDPKTGNPKGKIAWKFREEEAHPVVINQALQVGRTGKVVPVAEFEGVQLAGTNVTRATMHNFGFVKKHGIVNGTKIRVIKAGKIIPKVIGVVSGKGTPNIPTKCPVCGDKLEQVKGGDKNDPTLELFCRNTNCAAKHINQLEHYLTTIGVLGIGSSRIEQLVTKGVVKTFADFYKLTLDQIQSCGLSERQALLVLAAIQMVPNPEKEKDNDKLVKKISDACKRKRRIPAWKVFASLGIPTAGKSAGKALVAHYGSFEAIRKASIEEMSGIEDIGEKTAEVVVRYLGENADVIDELLQFVEPETPKVGKLTGKVFCLSGSFDEGKKHWESLIENLGGKCSGSVGSKTDYLVAGPGSGAKSDKAKQIGVKIINVEQLKKLF